MPFANEFPNNTKLYQLMTTKPGEGLDAAAGGQGANATPKQSVQGASPILSNEEEVLNMIRRVSSSNPEFGEKMRKYLTE